MRVGAAARWERCAALPAAAVAVLAALGCAPAATAPEPAPDTDPAPPAAESLPGRLPVEDRQWTTQYDHHFRKYSKRYFGPGFDWRWFKAQGIAESGLRKDATSWVGARGIMQIMPATLKEIAEKSSLALLDDTDPGQNIAAGVFYDRYLYDLWDDVPQHGERLAFTFASYNGGRSRMLRAQERCTANCGTWAQVNPYAPEETQGYVARIMRLMGNEQP